MIVRSLQYTYATTKANTMDDELHTTTLPENAAHPDVLLIADTFATDLTEAEIDALMYEEFCNAQ